MGEPIIQKKTKMKSGLARKDSSYRWVSPRATKRVGTHEIIIIVVVVVVVVVVAAFVFRVFWGSILFFFGLVSFFKALYESIRR